MPRSPETRKIERVLKTLANEKGISDARMEGTDTDARDLARRGLGSARRPHQPQLELVATTPTVKRLPPRLLLLVGPVCGAGLLIALAATVSFVTGPLSFSGIVGPLALAVASTVASRYPVPIEGAESGGVTLSFVFGTAGIVLFGWDAGILIALAAPATMQLIEHRPLERVAYNASVFAIGAAAAAVLVGLVQGSGTPTLVLEVLLSAAAQYAVNLVLVSAAVAGSARRAFSPLVGASARATIVPFTLMASAALMLVVLWQRSPVLSAALVGPLLAISLYQRSAYQALRAMRLALTDPLTGLGNHRSFQEQLQRELSSAAARDLTFTLCMLDIDDFKRVNDWFGHPAGDRVLAQIGARLRQNGEAFRLGGDEFALLLPGYGADEALPVAQSILTRIAGLKLDDVGSVTASAGLASFPQSGLDRDELIRLADSALYWAKEHGKNRVHLYRQEVLELADLRRLAHGPDRAARFRAAASLAQAVDARDTYTGSHSTRVADLGAWIAARLGLDVEYVELTRLAGSLHDLGKLAVPEEILRKPGPLTPAERMVLERHSQIGFRMLESLGVDPVADWVLHHHERWDGTGYPDGLAGEEIPLGARIIFVADAYEAMTSDRAYRSRLTPQEAVAELERCAGTQFDPEIVSVFARELSHAPATAAAAG
jgi:diguanylate cyclase (GGDEF)-like protein/putative nucleotidyltransferase with HDIG domain